MAAKPNIHLFVGEDSYLVEAAARRVLEAAVPADLRATAVETVAGEADNAETQLASIRECAASVQTPPFLDPVKLTWWRGVTFLPNGGTGERLAEDVKAAFGEPDTDAEWGLYYEKTSPMMNFYLDEETDTVCSFAVMLSFIM